MGELTREQILQWMAFLELEPPDADRADVREAFHAAKNLNQWISEKANHYTVRELIIEWDKEREPVAELTGEEKAKAMAAAICARWG